MVCRFQAGMCLLCGRPLPAGVELPYWRVCPAAILPPVREEADVKLGDRVEQLLASIGIIEDRYKQVKALFGLPPTCGCSQRKAWLNRVSDWWRNRPEGS